MALGDVDEPQARSLYLYVNNGIETLEAEARSLYAYVNNGVEEQEIEARSLYAYANNGIEALDVLARALYAYEATNDDEVFPWLSHIRPTEQYRGGQVNLYGDGLGELLEAATGATITTSSVNGSNIGGYAVDRTVAEWVSNDGSGAWIRFTFGAAKTIVGVALEDRVSGSNSWGVPQFRFSDGGPNVAGDTTVPKPTDDTQTAEYPVGVARTYYALPAPRTTTYVEVRVQSGGDGSNRGLTEVWILEDQDQAAETSTAVLNDSLPAETLMGIVAWRNRSPGLWPANGGLPLSPAATVTVPAAAVSGMVLVQEDT